MVSVYRWGNWAHGESCSTPDPVVWMPCPESPLITQTWDTPGLLLGGSLPQISWLSFQGLERGWVLRDLHSQQSQVSLPLGHPEGASSLDKALQDGVQAIGYNPFSLQDCFMSHRDVVSPGLLGLPISPSLQKGGGGSETQRDLPQVCLTTKLITRETHFPMRHRVGFHGLCTPYAESQV